MLICFLIINQRVNQNKGTNIIYLIILNLTKNQLIFYKLYALFYFLIVLFNFQQRIKIEFLNAINLSSSGIGNREACSPSSIKLIKMITSPRSLLVIVLSQIEDSSLRIVSFHQRAFIPSINIIMERIFESKCEVCVCALNSDNQCPLNSMVSSPSIRNQSRSVEKSGFNDVRPEVLLNSSIFHLPADNFKVFIEHIISNLYLVESIVGPVISLVHVPAVVNEVNVVVPSEVVGREDFGRTGY